MEKDRNDFSNCSKDENSANRKDKFMNIQKLNLNRAIRVSVQQDIIEMISILFSNNRFTIEDIMREQNKSRSSVYRMFRFVNSYGVLMTSLNSEKFTQVKMCEKFYENQLDSVFKVDKRIPLVYIFLKSLIRFISVSAVMQIFNISEKKAKEMIYEIVSATYFGEFQLNE